MANSGLDKVTTILSSVESSTRSGFSHLPNSLKGIFEPVVKPDL
jgi:hypothetical protein